MASRLKFENSNDIGCFLKLTNAYCLVSTMGSQNFYSAISFEASKIPTIYATIAGTKIVGRMTAGNTWANRTPVMLPTSTVGSMTFDRPYSIAVASLSGCLSFRVMRYRVTEPNKIVKPLIAIASFVPKL